MRKIFFGTLRAAELEHLIERSWYAVTETCLAFTVFRDELTPKFVGLFALLLFLKCFHWLAEDRVDFMEQSPNINVLFHIRIVSLLATLAMCDVAFIYYAYQSIAANGQGTQLVFGFEYAILLATMFNILIKYVLHWIDLTSEAPWEDRAVCLLYTELAMGVIKVGLYLLFVGTMLKYHNFPLFALRPIYLSLRSLKKALCDVIMSRRAIRNMNTLYPDATAEELAISDNVCIICREEMVGNGSSKKLPCNHIFHVSCLRSWFQRQQTCPTCRMDILRIPANNANQANQNQARPNRPNQPNPTGQQANASNNVNTNNIPTTSTNASNSNNNSNGGSSATTSTNQTSTSSGPAHLGPQQVIVHDEVAALMIQSFAQIFVQAMLTHLNNLNLANNTNDTASSNQQQQTQVLRSNESSGSQTKDNNMNISTEGVDNKDSKISSTTESRSTTTNSGQVERPKSTRDNSTQTE